MKNIFNKTILLGYAILSFCNFNSVFGGEFKFGFELKLDFEGVSVNGQNIRDSLSKGSYMRWIITKSGALLGWWIGHTFAEKRKTDEKYLIKDLGALGSKLGEMLITLLYYNDRASSKLLVAQAVGEQAGAHLFDTEELFKNNKVSQTGKIVGSS